MDDMDLLREYATNNSEQAFATLVNRHVDFVYSSALRQTGNPHSAEEITQVVFIILARKAGLIRQGTILSGWLFRTTRFAANDALKKEIRRQRREQEAFQMEPTFQQPDIEPEWQQVSPILDQAIAQLGEQDRNAVLLRFFEKKNFKEVGHALGTTEETAKKRVSRAMDKLRNFLGKRGTVFPAVTLIGIISTNSVSAAPVGLASSITTAAVLKGTTASASTLTLLKGTLKIMAWSKAKTAVIAAGGLLLIAGTTTTTWYTYFKPTSAFNSFGPEKNYNSRVGWSVGFNKPRPGDSGFRGQAEWFIPATSGKLKEIEMALRPSRQSPDRGGALELYVAEDDNGVPGKILERFSNVRSVATESSVSPQTLVLKSKARPQLNAGKKYWLCAEPVDENSHWTWYQNSQQLAKGFAYERENGKWNFVSGGPNNGAFSISVSR